MPVEASENLTTDVLESATAVNVTALPELTTLVFTAIEDTVRLSAEVVVLVFVFVLVLELLFVLLELLSVVVFVVI